MSKSLTQCRTQFLPWNTVRTALSCRITVSLLSTPSQGHIHRSLTKKPGGRQLDGAIGSLTALARICADPRVRKAQQLGTFTVLFDSGIRSGSDIIKAIALGAQTVLVGRPYVYGLALGGEAGVDAVMRSILADLDISLALSGYKSISEIWHKRDEVLVEDDT